MIHTTTRPQVRIHKRGNWMRLRDPKKLRSWRLHRELTQRELAFLCKCSQNTIHLLESGQMTSLSEDLAVTICKRLDIPCEEVFVEREHSGVRRVTSGTNTKARKAKVA